MKGFFTREELLDFNQRNRDRWVARIAERLPPGSRVLDVGAGECRYRPLFQHCEYKAQDFGQYKGSSEGLLSQTWSYGPLDFVCDASTIPIADESFDAVLCTEVLEHVPDPVKVLQEIWRVLREGGRVFLSAPLGSGLHQQPFHFYGGFTPYFYRHFLSTLSFEIVSIERNGGFFLMLLQEMHRGMGIIQAHRHYRWWHPARWLLRLASSRPVANWFKRLDDEIPITEFTVGYHVEAVKTKKVDQDPHLQSGTLNTKEYQTPSGSVGPL